MMDENLLRYFNKITKRKNYYKNRSVKNVFLYLFQR